jgi:hypothetical protein
MFPSSSFPVPMFLKQNWDSAVYAVLSYLFFFKSSKPGFILVRQNKVEEI